MANSKTNSKTAEANIQQANESSSLWRKPLALPVSKESKAELNKSQHSNPASANEATASASRIAEGQQNKPQELMQNKDSERPLDNLTAIHKASAAGQDGETWANENSTVKRLSESELCKLLKVEDQDDLYNLQDVFRGSSLALYCVLLIEANGEGRCRIPSKKLMSRAGIQTLVTLHKQEDWLTKLMLIKKNVMATNHHGSSYRVYPLEVLPLRPSLLAQLETHLEKYRNQV